MKALCVILSLFLSVPVLADGYSGGGGGAAAYTPFPGGTAGITIASLPTCNASILASYAYLTNGLSFPANGGVVSSTGSTWQVAKCVQTSSGLFQWVYAMDNANANALNFIGQAITNSTVQGTVTSSSGARIKISDQGTCTMSAGACSAQTLNSTYSAAPVCLAVVATAGGTPATPLKAPSTTTTVTPATGGASDTSVVNWACFGN